MSRAIQVYLENRCWSFVIRSLLVSWNTCTCQCLERIVLVYFILNLNINETLNRCRHCRSNTKFLSMTDVVAVVSVPLNLLTNTKVILSSKLILVRADRPCMT